MNGALVYGLAFGPSGDGEELELFAMGSGRRVRLGESDRLVIAFVALGNHGDESAYYALVDDEYGPIFEATLAPGGQECRPCHTRPISMPAGRLPLLVAGGRGGVLVLGAVQPNHDLNLCLADAA